MSSSSQPHVLVLAAHSLECSSPSSSDGRLLFIHQVSTAMSSPEEATLLLLWHGTLFLSQYITTCDYFIYLSIVYLPLPPQRDYALHENSLYLSCSPLYSQRYNWHCSTVSDAKQVFKKYLLNESIAMKGFAPRISRLNIEVMVRRAVLRSLLCANNLLPQVYEAISLFLFPLSLLHHQ